MALHTVVQDPPVQTPAVDVFRPPVQMRVAGIDLMSVRSRIVVLFLLTWPPLLVLTTMSGVASGSGVGVPLLYDFVVSVRFLIAVPLVVYADALIRARATDLCRYLVVSGIVAETRRAAFEELAARFARRRDSHLARVAIAVVVVFTTAFLRFEFSGDLSTWQFVATAAVPTRSAAGWWYLFVSVPVFQWLFGVGLWRYAVWCWFLLKVSRLALVLVPTHPDRSAGLTMVGNVHQYYAMFACALSAIVSAHIGLELLKGGQSLAAFQLQAGGLLILATIGLLLPLLAFTPGLISARKQGLMQYGVLAADYTRTFHRKWIDGPDPAGGPLLGSADIQSLADLAGSFEVVQQTRIVPFGLRTVITILVWTVVPFTPLVFAVFSPIEVVKGLLKILL